MKCHSLVERAKTQVLIDTKQRTEQGLVQIPSVQVQNFYKGPNSR